MPLFSKDRLNWSWRLKKMNLKEMLFFWTLIFIKKFTTFKNQFSIFATSLFRFLFFSHIQMIVWNLNFLRIIAVLINNSWSVRKQEQYCNTTQNLTARLSLDYFPHNHCFDTMWGEPYFVLFHILTVMKTTTPLQSLSHCSLQNNERGMCLFWNVSDLLHLL